MFSKKDTPFLKSREHAIVKTVVSLSPLTDGLDNYPVRVYTASPLPILNPKLYYQPRDKPSYADSTSSGARRGGGIFDLVGISRQLANKSNDQCIYMAWFITFAASLDTLSEAVAYVATRTCRNPLYACACAYPIRFVRGQSGVHT
ncbi:hypothetical protein EON62_00305 [archaeon]|nr:MAG: hypothetical protein EON62_00305 [archaeon]